MVQFPLSPSLLHLINCCHQEGVDIYAVGGCIRDLLLQQASQDIDLLVEADACKLFSVLQKKLGGQLQLHQAFRTVRWRSDKGQCFDITSSRKEIYEKPGALPKIQLAPILEDLSRRDFTINAMAIHLSNGKLLDPYKGQSDLFHRRLRILHPKSFEDDPSRLLRGLRFQARQQLHFEKKTWRYFKEAIYTGALHTVDASRLGRELWYGFQETHAATFIQALSKQHHKISILQQIFVTLQPALLLKRLQNSQRLVQSGQDAAIDKKQQALLLFYLLALCLPEQELRRTQGLWQSVTQLSQQWLQSHRLQKIIPLWQQKDKVILGMALTQLTATQQLATASCATKSLRHWLWWQKKGRYLRTNISGNDLIVAGFQPGPAFQKALKLAQTLAFQGKDLQQQWQSVLTWFKQLETT